jgi:transcriptional regulator with XRE-family HTH domain
MPFMGRTTHITPKYKTVAEAMKALALTDQSVADSVGCDRSWITKVRRGEKVASLRLPIKIARHLKVPVESLGDVDAA